MSDMKDSGVTTGTWGEAGDRVVRPKLLDDHLERMLKLLNLLEQAENHLQKELVAAKETLAQQKHGGGK